MNTDIIMNNTSTTEATSVAVKVIKGEEMRRFNFKSQSFQELKKIISEIYNIPEEDFFLQYEDDEKDKVTLSTDAELKEAIQLHKYVLRFFVVVTKPAVAGEIASPVSPFHSHPHPPYYHHRHHHHHEAELMAAEGDATVPPFGRHGPHGRPFGPGNGPHRGHGHGPHGHHKRRFEKEEKEAMKCERKKWKKQRKCESSSSSEDDTQKQQKKEMKQLMKATKESIKANWAPVKDANPAQWGQNRQLMVAEIKLAKRIIREQANKASTPTPVPAPAPAPAPVVVTEQNTPITPTGAEMQA